MNDVHKVGATRVGFLELVPCNRYFHLPVVSSMLFQAIWRLLDFLIVMQVIGE